MSHQRNSSIKLTHLTNDEDVLVVGKGGGEDIDVATIGEFELLAEVGNGKGEVPNGDVGAVDITQDGLQFLFIHR